MQLLEMVHSRRMRKTRKHMKRNAKRKLNHRGGAGGSGFEPDGRLSAAAPYAMVHKTYDGCMATARPGAMGFSMSGGLPGMRGGAYTNNLASPINGFAQIDKDPSHCAMPHRGGAGLQLASAAPILQESTARYSMAPSSFTGSTGAPILLSKPLDQVAWSKACTSTGGGRFTRAAMRKMSRTFRKSSQKSKKSRKSRKQYGGSNCAYKRV